MTQPEANKRAATPTGLCSGCERTWVGTRAAHCPRCHRHFSTDRHYASHLITDNGIVVGCADPAELKQPLRLVDGTWKAPPPPNGSEHWSEGRHGGSDQTDHRGPNAAHYGTNRGNQEGGTP